MYPYSRIDGLMSEPTLAILDDLTALADITRDRLLLLLEAQELTVSELCTVLQLPQSTVSRHLKSLADAGWVLSRAEATSRLYTMATSELSAGSRQLWLVVREQVADGRAALEDHRRLQAVLAQRRSRSQAFFSSAAGQWDHLREELFGATFHLQALAGLLDPTWTVGDLGCGTGPMTAAIAPFVDRVIAVDDSPEMLAAARRRIGNESDGELDAAMLTLVLPYLPTPPKVLAEVARAMAGGGRLLVTDLVPHDRESFRQQLGHQWLGFSESQITEWLANAGFNHIRVHRLPPSPEAKGPGLFVASATRTT
jgi:ArsR family transcriptional regulator